MTRATLAATLGSALLASAAGSAASEPLDLSDPTPRPVAVRFEVSPSDRPGDRARRFTPPITGRLEAEAPGFLRLRIPGEAVERTLLAEQDPLAGSFSDFVWLLEVATGEVLSAELSGVLTRQVNWGLVGVSVAARIETRMSTLGEAGFRQPVSLLGHRIFAYCGPEEPDCELVPPRRFDPATGYVNAVGEISAHSPLLTTRSFCPLGEAILEELRSEHAESVAE